MRLWKVGHSADNNEWVEIEGGNFPVALELFDDTPKQRGWKTLRLAGIDGTCFPLEFDSPRFTGRSLVLTERAKECLESLFADCVELLPAELNGQGLWIAHVMSLQNCIDYAASCYDTWASDGKIRGFFEYQFNEEAVRGFNLFGIKDEMVFSPFVSDAFISRVEECGLKGFSFDLVWDSELPLGSITFETICV